MSQNEYTLNELRLTYIRDLKFKLHTIATVERNKKYKYFMENKH